ncbi:putative ribonuclease H-like domain-containing protein [Tanacetum coccineum]
MSRSQDEIPPPPPPPPPPSSSQTSTQQTPHTVSTIKLPILKKREYDIWAMKMEHYLAHTDYPIWEVIQNGNGPVSITTDTQGQIKVLPPRTAEEIVARERERKARTTLLMALPEDHLAKFHKMTDAKEMWDAIKSRFGGNDESKKMQKYILKQQFEGFSVSNSEGLHKGYDRFQSLLSQLEIHGAGVSTEDANQKFLRSLPSAWSQVSLIMRTKPGVDSLSFDDLYNNLRVFENDVKGSTASSSSTQNVAFVSENTSSTNDVSTAYSVSNPSGQNSQYEQTSSYSLLANQSSCPQLDHEDLEQLDEYDLEEMDLKWQVAMISMRMKKFYKKTGRKLQFDAKEPVGFDKTKVECYNCHKIGHFARECRTKGNQDSRRRDAWNSGNKDGRKSGKQEDSKSIVTIDGRCRLDRHSEEERLCFEVANSQGQTQRNKGIYSGLKKVEAQLVAHQQGQLWYEQKIKFMKIDLDDKTDVLTYHKKLLAETMKEKEDLKAKLEKWHNSSKNLCKLINTQMSANDKFGLGYGDHRYDVILSYENEVLQSVFKCTETPELVSEPVGNESNVACQPNVWSDAPIIEEYESYSEDEYVSIPTKEQETPSFANQQVKAPRETIKNHFTHSKNHKFDKKELGYGFNARASFVCRTLNHLIRDCDLHEKRMAKQAELNNRLNRNSINTARTSGTKNVSTARHSFNRQAVLTSAAMKVNTVKPIVNRVNAVSAVGGKRETAIKPSAIRDHKDTTGTMHMTEQGLPCEFKLNGGLVTFGGCKEFKNRDFIEFCGSKGIKREYSNARTPQQNGVAERKNRTLIEAARTMLADSFLPNTFWAEAVSTACYVLNRVLVTKPHNKTPYELVTGKIPIISYIRPFGCHVTILNTIDHLGKFDGKSDEGFLVGYSLQSKAFRVYNLETKRVEENLHITFLENKPNVAGKGPTWLFDLDYLTDSMNYQHVRSENQANKHAGPQEANQNAGTEDIIDAEGSEKEDESAQDYFVLPIWSSYSSTVKRSIAKDAGDAPNKHPDLKTNGKPVDKEDQVFLDELERLKRQEKDANDAAEALRKEFAQETKNLLIQAGAAKASSTNIVNTVSTPVSTASPYGGLSFTDPTNPDQDDSEIPALEDIYQHPTDGIFTNSSYDDEGAVADFTNLETVVNKNLLQFKIQKVWILVNLPYGKKAIGTKWVYRNKKDERGVVVRNKARLVAQGHRQEEGIDYDEVFAPMARIEAIRIFLAFASYMGFIVYQMDVKSAFLYGKIDEEFYVSQPPGFIDPKYTQKVYKVVKALYGLHQAPRACFATLSTFLLQHGYRRGTIDKTFFIKKDKHDIILVQVYVDDIIFGSTKKTWCDEFKALIKGRFQMSSMGELTFFLRLQTASTPIETQKPLVKDEEASDVDVHLYRSMIGSLMYLTTSRPDIMFTVCACSRFQVTSKTSHLRAVKRIFRYLKGKPKLGLWYPRVSSFDLEAYSDSDYVGANLDRKSTTGEAEYVAAANCCGQVLWIQNQMLDYGFKFMNTKIYFDNESTICIVKNPVYHSKTKHIAIRHHFVRDAYEKKLIHVLKIHTNDNVADRLTKAFDVSRFQFLVVTIGMINP